MNYSVLFLLCYAVLGYTNKTCGASSREHEKTSKRSTAPKAPHKIRNHSDLCLTAFGITEDDLIHATPPGEVPMLPPTPYSLGQFDAGCVGDLRLPAQAVQPFALSNNPQLTVIVYDGTVPERIEEADVAALQAKPHNADAYFQLASRAHCAEGHANRRWWLPRAHGNNAGQSVFTGVQGERAAAGVFPAYAYRFYMVPPREADLCRMCNDFFTTDSVGSINFNIPKMKQLLATDSASKDQARALSDRVRVALHHNIGVFTGNSYEKIVIPPAQSQHIHQIITFAANAAWIPQTLQPWRNIIFDIFLRAAYKGTVYHVAIHANELRQRAQDRHRKQPEQPHCFFTLMGAGVFHNPIGMVTRRLIKALRFCLKKHIRATVVFFDHDLTHNAEKRAALKQICSFIEQHNGQINWVTAHQRAYRD